MSVVGLNEMFGEQLPRLPFLPEVLLLKTMHFLMHTSVGRKAPSHKMGSVCLFVCLFVFVCRFCTLDADWFAALLLSAHHMLGQRIGTSVDLERYDL